MADQHKALVNALKNLKGIHESGGKKASTKDKRVVAEVEEPMSHEKPAQTAEAESDPTFELKARKRKKVASGSSSQAPSVDGSGNSEAVIVKEIGARYRAVIDKMPLPRRFADMESEGYEAVTYSLLQK